MQSDYPGIWRVNRSFKWTAQVVLWLSKKSSQNKASEYGQFKGRVRTSSQVLLVLDKALSVVFTKIQHLSYVSVSLLLISFRLYQNVLCTMSSVVTWYNRVLSWHVYLFLSSQHELISHAGWNVSLTSAKGGIQFLHILQDYLTNQGSV